MSDRVRCELTDKRDMIDEYLEPNVSLRTSSDMMEEWLVSDVSLQMSSDMI
ncbi:hypothetical protein HAX54_041665 [Datura stramonium]|uniref:Uncharacterized protein n=1 Tax=Datura stramonium TaxID=4076 RepID=A0ABS8VXJ3_DATST|nr:hypothetical protein [Datura stramonium]